MKAASHEFPTATDGLAGARGTSVVSLADGDSFELRIAPVTKTIGGATVRMLAYNGSIPGPTLRVAEGSAITVNVENRGDLAATVHWHGLRLDSRFDGTHETQRPMEIGETFAYRLEFPDPGAYWYHPHIRQDYGQEMGLYGSIIVVPRDSDYWPPAHRDLAITLDDILIEDGAVGRFSPSETTYSAMGRFGNHMLVNGEPELTLAATAGEVVRLYLTNTANTRVFNFAVRGARMKVVGGDSGRCEHETFENSVVIAPSERVVVDVLFDAQGVATLEHRTPERTYDLAFVNVSEGEIDPAPTQAFEALRANPEWHAERERIAPFRDAEPDKTIAFIAEMDFDTPEGPTVFTCPMHPAVVRPTEGPCPECGMKLLPKPGIVIFTCPMHPEVALEAEGKCPVCGMKLMPTVAAMAYTCPMHADVVSDAPGKCPECGMKLMPTAKAPSVAGPEVDSEPHSHEHDHSVGGIEWEDDMVDVNRGTTPANTRWKLVDRPTGAEGHAIDWKFRVGDQVKIRLVNEMDSDHPMHHPFHIHGAGRFLVLSRDGLEDPNLVWTDTVLVKAGEVVDILLDVTHAGRWMAHCHIAEHHESGMMLGFDVVEA